jgi:hypothetical protein
MAFHSSHWTVHREQQQQPSAGSRAGWINLSYRRDERGGQRGLKLVNDDGDDDDEENGIRVNPDFRK